MLQWHKELWDLTAIQACASIPHSIACLGFPRACSFFSTSSIIMVNDVLACAVRPSAPSSGTVGPKPLGYCSVRIAGMPRIRLACEGRTAGRFKKKKKKYIFCIQEQLGLHNCETAFPTWSIRAALLTMLVNWKMLGLNFSCMSQRKSTESLVESLPMLATAKTRSQSTKYIHLYTVYLHMHSAQNCPLSIKKLKTALASKHFDSSALKRHFLYEIDTP